MCVYIYLFKINSKCLNCIVALLIAPHLDPLYNIHNYKGILPCEYLKIKKSTFEVDQKIKIRIPILVFGQLS